MASVAVSTLGCTDIHFLEPDVKVNGDYYPNTVLCNMLLPDIRRISGDWYIFQQDSAPAHRARATMDFLERETPEFISPLLLPPNSPALNAVEYSVWSISYCKRMCTKHASLISTTSNIVSEPSGPSWITPSLLQLCVSGVVVFQLVSGRAVVISSTAFNPDIVFCGTCSV